MPNDTAIRTAIAPPRQRDASIDLLRAIAMVVMALDHARDFFGSGADPTDLAHTTPALFFTRWITHFCAPTFVLLAGTAAFLSAARKPRSSLSRSLLARGAWLLILELTVVRFAWLFDPGWHFVFLQVIWAIGWSMIALAALVWLRPAVIAAIGLGMIALHDALDGIHAAAFGAFRPLWLFLHEPGRIDSGLGAPVYVAYPVVPWIGVMACGYAFGAWAKPTGGDVDPAARRRRTLLLGAALTSVFVLLRATNLYGDARPWSWQPSAAMTVASFLDCVKYPPSLCYLTMTLGPALMLLPALDRVSRAMSAGASSAASVVGRVLVVYGRVPLFYYVLHILLIHLVAASVGVAHDGALAGLSRVYLRQPLGWSLPAVYAAWLAIVAALWWPCRWFTGVKSRRTDWWLSYL